MIKNWHRTYHKNNVAISYNEKLVLILVFILNFVVLCFFCSICERVTPRLSHANAAVVLSAVKVQFNEHVCSKSTL